MGKGSVAKTQDKSRPLEDGLTSDESDDECIEQKSGVQELSEYEKKRLDNVRRNNALLAELNFTQIKEEFHDVAGKRKQVLGTQGLPRAKKQKQIQENLPRRQSLRIRRIDPVGNPLPDLPTPPEPIDEHPRKPSGPISMEPQNEVEDKDSTAFLRELGSYNSEIKVSNGNMKNNKSVVTLTEFDSDRYEKSLESLIIKQTHVAKLVPQRISSMTIHPSSQKTVVVAGDKWGRLGLWDVGSTGGNDGVYLYEPHSRNINCVAFSREDWSQLYTSSYDGTMRCADFRKGVFNEVYATEEDDCTRIVSFSCVSPSSRTILAGLSDGTVIIIDTRKANSHSKADNCYQLHDKTIKCVDVHPLNPNLFISSSNDCTVALWDLRNIKNMKSKLGTMNRSRSVTSAYFSPLTGKQIVATSMDHYLTVCEVEPSGTLATTPKCTFRHFNDTGRWLSQFRATWDPKSDSYFVVGNMSQPRQVDVFSSEKKGGAVMHLVHENMNSITSLNVFHPTKNILAGGNSSGKVYIWT